MKTMQQTWKRFLATMALASAINSNSDAVSAADSTQPAGTSATASARSVGRGGIQSAASANVATPPARACFGVDPRLRQRYGINPMPGAPIGPTPAPKSPIDPNRKRNHQPIGPHRLPGGVL